MPNPALPSPQAARMARATRSQQRKILTPRASRAGRARSRRPTTTQPAQPTVLPRVLLEKSSLLAQRLPRGAAPRAYTDSSTLESVVVVLHCVTVQAAAASCTLSKPARLGSSPRRAIPSPTPPVPSARPARSALAAGPHVARTGLQTAGD